MAGFVRILAIFLTIAGVVPAAAGPAEEAIALMDRWSATYSANDRDLLVSLYAPDAILLGTTSPVISKGTDDIRTYFGALPGSGRKNAIGERHVIVLSDDAVLGAGFYTFTRAVENDTPRPSRFTMLVVRRDGKWMILHHHSSPRAEARQ